MDTSRRSILQGLAALPALSLIASCGLSGAGKAEITKDELAFLSALADTIIPTTESSPGALAGKVPATLADVLNVWASAETRGRWSTSLAALKRELDAGASGSFEKASIEERTRRLGKLDAAVFAVSDHPLKAYREVKSTIATAYYMSEPGATQDLRYDAAPGDFDGNAPMGKTWAI
jgi:gluconate 2-dehydrogenase gamma chain